VALRRSSSRSITVDGEHYRWTFADNLDVWNVTIQQASGAGQKLVINFDPLNSPPTEITPSIVARGIRLALGAGWTPSSRGAPLRAKFEGDALQTWRA